MACGLTVAIWPHPSAPAAEAIRFDRDILPVLAENCFACHGPDAGHRQADLRLDTFAGATADRDGARAIKPGNPQASELLTRIHSTDPDVVMPPPDSNKRLRDAEKALLEQWIAAGAAYDAHWAYKPLTRPDVPASVSPSGLPGHPIDAFVDARLATEGLSPLPEADRTTLARRVAIDLTGLPPEPAAIDAFLADPSPDAYERMVDRLLASSHHAERLAAWWLDLVRYGDSVGYHGDQEIAMWPYRDWVINAFAANMPFDQFTREQLAGDLIPDATRDQKIAAAYNRLNLMSAEGGGQDKEYHAKYASDRVRATSGVWLGSTLGCAECHDHKFDPFTTRDFYAFAAFFADVQERGIYHGAGDNGLWGEMMWLPSPEQAAKQADLEAQVAAAKAAVEAANGDGPRDEAAAELKRLEGELKAAIDAQPRMPATVSGPPRVVRVLPRGNWMNDSGEIVAPAPPAFLPAASRPTPASADERLSRLDLARWMTAQENPLVPRVLANRLWAICFGQGVSRHLDDHGSQGEPPSHPELLDWLACELRDGDGDDGSWDIRRVLRMIVTSAAYRRSSDSPAGVIERDPENRLLARQNRHRIDAEMVRDTALAAGGLLARQVGGRSVRPYQPEGYWDYLNFPKRTYQADTGESLYRRGLYVHWQRQYLHPAMMVFDAPSREECTARRPRSSTPLQALVLLNDPEFVEAARALAAKTLAEGGGDLLSRARFMLRRAVGRVPTEDEVGVVADLVERHRQLLAADAPAANEMLAIGALPPPAGIDPIEMAAWTSAARAVLNLHETYTRN
jgi:mono/diheme cytochrome c family protein